MKVGIIGGTGHYAYVLSGLKAFPDANLAGLAPGSADENLDALNRMSAREGQNPRRFADYRAMLDDLEPDVVAIACHFCDHATVAIEALQRGINVFIEKPMATTFDDFRLLRNAYAQTSGLHLAAMHGMRYEAPFLTAWEAARAGAVGRVRLMHAQKSYKLGVRGDIYRRRETYGGTIPWVGSHAIDWFPWFSGEDFVSVWAAHSRRNNRDQGDLEVSALCQFMLTNEVLASASIDYLRPDKAPTHGDDRIRLVGTQGIIEVRQGRVWLTDELHGERELPLCAREEIFADFLAGIRGGGRQRIGAEESFYITEASLLARQSADEGRVIAFEPRHRMDAPSRQ